MLKTDYTLLTADASTAGTAVCGGKLNTMTYMSATDTKDLATYIASVGSTDVVPANLWPQMEHKFVLKTCGLKHAEIVPLAQEIIKPSQQQIMASRYDSAGDANKPANADIGGATKPIDTTAITPHSAKVNGCAYLVRGVKNILYVPGRTAAPTDDTFFKTCDRFSSHTNPQKIHMDFSGMGIDVIHGLCHIISSFLKGANKRNTLHLKFDDNFVGQPDNLLLSGYATQTSGPVWGYRSDADKFTRAIAYRAAAYCSNPQAWNSAFDPTAAIEDGDFLNRVFISYRNNRFSTGTKLDPGVVPGSLWPPSSNTRAMIVLRTNAAALLKAAEADNKPADIKAAKAMQSRIERNAQSMLLGNLDLTSNEQLKVLVIANSGASFAVATGLTLKDPDIGFKLPSDCKVYLTDETQKCNLKDVPDPTDHGLTDTGFGTQETEHADLFDTDAPAAQILALIAIAMLSAGTSKLLIVRI